MQLPVWLSRLFLQVTLGLCVLFILKSGWGIYTGYIQGSSPLIPERLGHFIAFPNVIFILLYACIGYISYVLIKMKDFDGKAFYPAIFLLLLEIGKIYLYAFLQWINPFG